MIATDELRHRTATVPRRTVAEAAMETAESGRRLQDFLEQLARANPRLIPVIASYRLDAQRCEHYGRLIAGLTERGAA